MTTKDLIEFVGVEGVVFLAVTLVACVVVRAAYNAGRRYRDEEMRVALRAVAGFERDADVWVRRFSRFQSAAGEEMLAVVRTLGPLTIEIIGAVDDGLCAARHTACEEHPL